MDIPSCLPHAFSNHTSMSRQLIFNRPLKLLQDRKTVHFLTLQRCRIPMGTVVIKCHRRFVYKCAWCYQLWAVKATGIMYSQCHPLAQWLFWNLGGILALWEMVHRTGRWHYPISWWDVNELFERQLGRVASCFLRLSVTSPNHSFIQHNLISTRLDPRSWEILPARLG